MTGEERDQWDSHLEPDDSLLANQLAQFYKPAGGKLSG